MSTESHTAIHKVYCEITNRELPLTMALHLTWNNWVRFGWAEAELRLVVNYIYSLIKQDRRRPESLRLYNLLDPDRFAMDLSEARARARVPRQDHERVRTLASTGRREERADACRPVRDILAAEAAFRQFQALKEQL